MFLLLSIYYFQFNNSNKCRNKCLHLTYNMVFKINNGILLNVQSHIIDLKYLYWALTMLRSSKVNRRMRNCVNILTSRISPWLLSLSLYNFFIWKYIFFMSMWHFIQNLIIKAIIGLRNISVVEDSFPSICEALGSISSTEKRNYNDNNKYEVRKWKNLLNIWSSNI